MVSNEQTKGMRRMSRLLNRRTLLVLLGLDLLLLAALVAYWGGLRSSARGLDDFGEAPSWMLMDQMGRQVGSDEFHGQVIVADFIYTNCRDTCPLLSLRMQMLQERLRTERLLGSQVQLLSFSTDPARDTPQVLRVYAAKHRADAQSWRFLTGPEARMRQLVVKGFHLGVQQVPLEEATPHSHSDGAQHRHAYDVMHSNRFVLIDRKGRMRALYDGTELDIGQVVRDIQRLL